MKQAHIFYSGMVQGIGFRFTTRSFAAEFNLTGWAKNLPDGRVELLAEGEEESINKFCRMLEEHFEGYIRDKRIEWDKAKGQFKDFQIVY
ncbi:MAG TPA: acylphosphatase [Candidatus Omnitrophota bacterium]|nr:acylphosphatase [Candidatus Omnitrophota bacterium]